jgi:hypothetical protein
MPILLTMLEKHKENQTERKRNEREILILVSDMLTSR